MKIIKDIIKLWNKGFKRGFNIFQWFLIGFMFLGVIVNNRFLVLFSMFVCLFAYFEPGGKELEVGGK